MDTVYISAPHVVPSLVDAEGEEAKQETDVRGWWFSKIDDSFCATDYVDICKGFEETLDEVGHAVKEQGPFDDQRFAFKFAILVAGFRSRSSPHNGLYSKGITLPSIHIFGDTDRVIPRGELNVRAKGERNGKAHVMFHTQSRTFLEMSEELLQCFIEPVVCTHPGGHFVPASPPQKKIYLDFLERFR